MTVNGEEELGLDATGAPHRRAGLDEQALARALAAALRISRLHALDNVVALDAQRELLAALERTLGSNDHMTVLAGDDRISLNGGAIRLKRQGRSWGHEFLEFLASMGIGGFTFSGRWDSTAVYAFLEIFASVRIPDPEARAKEIAGGVAAAIAPPAVVEILAPYVEGGGGSGGRGGGGDGESDLAEWQRAAFDYSRLVALAEATYAATAAGRSPDTYARELRHTLIRLLERSRELDFTIRLLGLTVLPYAGGNALAGHAVCVSILSVFMGRLLRLPRGLLVDLGFAAFFHDLGRSPEGWPVDAQGAAEDSALRQAHPIRGIALGLAGSDAGDAGLYRLVVALEHHRMPDGFPRDRSFLDPPHLFSRIVSVADAFDRLEKGSPFAPPLSPFAALSQIQAQRWRFEEPLTQLLRDVLGKWPRGTLLRLKEGSTGVVLDGGARWGDRPVIRRLLLPDGSPDEARKVAELATADMIIGVIDPTDVPTLDWRRAVLA